MPNNEMSNNLELMMNNSWNTPYIWMSVAAAVFAIFGLILLMRTSKIYKLNKSSFKELNNKIDNLYRTTDSFQELNTKIDNLNRSTEELKKSSPTYLSQ